MRFIALEQPLLEACGRYLKDPPALRLELEPGEGLVLGGGLRFFEAKDVLARLHSVWRINQQLVEPLGFAWRDPHAHKAPLADGLVVEVAESTLGTPHHELANLAGLLEYAGKRLQFITYDGAYYQGVLHKVGKWQSVSPCPIWHGSGGEVSSLGKDR